MYDWIPRERNEEADELSKKAYHFGEKCEEYVHKL